MIAMWIALAELSNLLWDVLLRWFNRILRADE